MVSFKPFAVNVRQRLLSTNQRKIYVNGLHILCWIANHRSPVESSACKHSLRWPSCRQMFSYLIQPSNWPLNSPVLIPVDYFNLGCSSAAGLSSEDQGYRPSDTSPEQLLGHDQPRTNQRCYWSMTQKDYCWSSVRKVETLDIISINSGCVLIANWTLSWLAPKMLLYEEYLISLFKRCHFCVIK